jgi:2-polyprenyl-3-methyl-5-hydroxy-6-metoxy-1,4-benzoquinol methylase
VGCGNGAFVEAASQNFVASGIELSSAAAEAARDRGLDVRAGDFIEMEFGGTKFDVITFWDVLAGCPDLDAVLRKCVSLMKPMSVLVGSVPLIGGMTAKTLRSRWPLLIPPVNIHYFDRRSIQMLAAKHGLNVIDVRSMGKKVACEFLIWKAFRSLKMFRLADKAAKFAPSWPISVNTGDITYFLLQRPVEEK